jgi:hypothetical protein
MPNQRKPGKKMFGFQATEEERAATKEAYQTEGFESAADFLRELLKRHIYGDTHLFHRQQ